MRNPRMEDLHGYVPGYLKELVIDEAKSSDRSHSNMLKLILMERYKDKLAALQLAEEPEPEQKPEPTPKRPNRKVEETLVAA
jgi:hypothetical protein